MSGRRRPKKSETVEVRLSHDVKSALMEKARGEGRSASEVIRASIDCYLAEQPKETRPMISTLWKPAAAIGATAIAAMWAAIAPAPLHAKPDLKAVFQAIDVNRDGTISRDEFVQHASNPAVQKLHAEQKGGMHAAMAAMHGQKAHERPSEDALRGHFSKIDADSNGSVTFAEFRTFHDHMERQHGAQ